MSRLATTTMAWCVCTSVMACAGDLPLGVVASKPADGRAVQVEQGYMVEYTETIPGTDVTFRMTPIPRGDYQFTQGDRSFTVRMAPCWMGKTEVTWAEYRQYMDLTPVFEKFDDQGIRAVTAANQVDAVTAPSKLYEPGFTFETGDQPTQPAVSMTQYAAKQYTKWLSLLTERFYRLPSEAEWEYACRGGTDAAYGFGDDVERLEQFAWYDDSNDFQTGLVASKAPNAWDLYDMHGNVAEWVLDAAAPTGDRPADGSEVSVEQAIAWPQHAHALVLKGGSWDSPAAECTVTSRMVSQTDDQWKRNDPNPPYSPWWFASYEGQQVGLRVVRPLEVPPRAQREKYWSANADRTLEIVNRRIDREGRGERGLVDPGLPNAIESIE